MPTESVTLPRGLSYTHDRMPGIRRIKAGKGFCYRLDNGRRVTSKKELQRIATLVIPPAYRDVWICGKPNGHLQATGRDVAGRKQYRYHPRWQAFASTTKFSGLVEFARALPGLRRRVSGDLARPALDRQRVIAAAVRLMELSLIRSGHGGETGGKPTFGLATLRSKHIQIKGQSIALAFRGKSGQMQERAVESGRLARTLRKCHGLPGQQLFQYLDEDEKRHAIDAGDLNDYVRESTGIDVSAKDFRTWGATVYAAAVLSGMEWDVSETQRKKNMVEAVRLTAKAIGNKPSTCRKYYIAPAVFTAYEEGWLREVMYDRADPDRPPPNQALRAEERATVKLLKRAERQAKQKAKPSRQA